MGKSLSADYQNVETVTAKAVGAVVFSLGIVLLAIGLYGFLVLFWMESARVQHVMQ